MIARRSASRSARAFTLLEVLIAIALTIGLLGAMFTFFWDLLATRQRVIDETARRRAAVSLMEHIERDLMTALVGDRVVGVGIAGTETSIEILCRTVPARRAERGGVSGFTDLERSAYRFESGSISARREAVRPGAGARATRATQDDAARFASLGGTVHAVRFRYHDGSSWLDAFDSLEADALPQAVEIAIWFDAPPGFEAEDETFDADFDAFGGPADRLTFDDDAGFDERAFALESDTDLMDEPPPDRIRVIALADGAPPDEDEDAPADEPDRDSS